MLNTPKFDPHLKAIQNDPEHLLLLDHLNNASKSLTKSNLIHKHVLPKTIGHFCKKISFSRNWAFSQISPNMNIARKFESHTVCICRHVFRTDFKCKINFKSNFHESVDFQRNALTSIFSKNAKNVTWIWARHFLKYLEVSDFEALFKSYKRSGHFGSLWIAFKWGLNLGGGV